MNQELEQFLNLRISPQRLTAEETAVRLRMSPHEIPILVSRGLLKPLGHPASNAPKYFLTAEIDDLKRDSKWHNKAADTLQEYWRFKNDRKLGRPQRGSVARQVNAGVEVE
jgi:hypothetical protein